MVMLMGLLCMSPEMTQDGCKLYLSKYVFENTEQCQKIADELMGQTSARGTVRVTGCFDAPSLNKEE